METKNESPLWTRDFTIITMGSVVSMLGNAIANFAIGLFVLDFSGSTLLFALYLVIYNIPRVLAPILAGPFLDRFSRKKTIYTLDFISSVIYLIYAIIAIQGMFQYAIILCGCLVLGTIDSIYSVAYKSLYPMLITEGNYSKAYSIDSTLQTMTLVMVPVSALLYNHIGIAPLFLLNALSFFIAAIFETKVQVQEKYIEKSQSKSVNNEYLARMKEGIAYLWQEKGLRYICMYFTITMFASGAYEVIVLPYFKANYFEGEYIYMYVMGCFLAGRIIGGSAHYRFKLPVNKKFSIAIIVYAATAIFQGTFLYFSMSIMMLSCFLCGILGVTSYNIRISATQSYVPDEKKGRFNGIFDMAVTIGMLSGQLISGLLTTFIPDRIVLSIFMAINFVGAILIVYRNKKDIKPIYNRQA